MEFRGRRGSWALGFVLVREGYERKANLLQSSCRARLTKNYVLRRDWLEMTKTLLSVADHFCGRKAHKNYHPGVLPNHKDVFRPPGGTERLLRIEEKPTSFIPARNIYLVDMKRRMLVNQAPPNMVCSSWSYEGK